MKISCDLIAPKFLYFLLMSEVSTLLIYCNIILSQKGVSASQIGAIDTVAYLTGFALRLVCGSIADRFGSYKVVMISLIFISTITLDCLLLVPTTSNNELTSLAMLDVTGNSTEIIDNTDNATQSNSLTFILSLLLKTIGLATYSPIICLLDAITFSLLKDRASEFGTTRMFGSVGYFAFALITGFALYGYKSMWSIATDYKPSFVIFTAEMFLTAIIVLILRVPATVRTQNPLKSLPLLFKSFHSIMFFVLVLLGGACFGVFESFLILNLYSMLKPPGYFFGLAAAVQVLAEAPLMYISGLVMQRIGEMPCLIIGFLAFSARFGLTSLLQSPWPLLAINSLHGLSFGIMYPAMLTLAAKLAPYGAQGTMQALVSGIYFGIGMCIGTAIAGPMIHILGDRVMLQLWCAVAAVVAVVAVILHFVLARFCDLDQGDDNQENHSNNHNDHHDNHNDNHHDNHNDNHHDLDQVKLSEHC